MSDSGRPFTTKKTDQFDGWLRKLRDGRAKARVLSRISQAEDGNFGDLKSVGDSVSEMRIHYGPGYRVYYTLRGADLILLLSGGEKDSQDRDIKRAKKIASDTE